MLRLRPAAIALALAASGLAAYAGAQPGALDRPFLGSAIGQDAIIAGMREPRPRQVRAVGTSSVTFRLELGERDAAFKPRSRDHSRGYLAEIAAYRVARALDMDNVPPAVSARISRPMLRNRLDQGSAAEWEETRRKLLWDDPGLVRGAAIYWIPNMRGTDLDEPVGMRRFGRWLAVDGEAPEGSAGLARDLSTMLAFDYLIANWDRFSGGNVSTNDDESRLFVRDHNIAFQAPINERRYRRLWHHLERTETFSRGFYDRLLRLDEAHLRAALAEDPEAETREILSDSQVAQVMMLRRALVSYIAALIELHGEERVLRYR